MKIILIRHGETIENKLKILQGHLPGKLSGKGIQQAKNLALKFKDKKINCIYSSDSARAADTAKKISLFHPSTPLKFTEQLRETDLSDWTGKKHKEIKDKDIPKNMETNSHLQQRARNVLNQISSSHPPNSTILIVAHNWINKALVSVILNHPPDYIAKATDYLNAEIKIFEI